MEEKINSDLIIKNIALQSDYSYNEVKRFYNIIMEQFMEYLRNKDKIELRGLGTFYTKEHKGRYVELKTKIIDSKNHFVILFKQSKKLNQRINENVNKQINEEL